jgi:hypothetical protein
MHEAYLVQTTHAEVVELSRLVYEDEKLGDPEVNRSQMPGNQSLRKGTTHDDPQGSGKLGGEVEWLEWR